MCFQNLDDSSDWNCANGQNLIDEWQADHPNKSSMVTDVTQLNNVNAAETDYLLGLFARADMSFDDKRDDLVDPSLSQMVDKTIEVWSAEEQQMRGHVSQFPNYRFCKRMRMDSCSL